MRGMSTVRRAGDHSGSRCPHLCKACWKLEFEGYAIGSRSNIDDSETFKALQISKRQKAPRAEAVLPAFVFLNLLERDAQGLAEVCLAYAERLPALAHPSADKFVDRIWASWGG